MSILVRPAAVVEPRGVCVHQPPCPAFNASDHDAARVIAAHPEQGWSLLCNGTVVFDDLGEIHGDGTTEPAHSNEPPHWCGRPVAEMEDEARTHEQYASACNRQGNWEGQARWTARAEELRRQIRILRAVVHRNGGAR